jgi:hypothetical protein
MANLAKKPMMQVRQGKLNFTTMSDIPEGASVLTGTFSYCHRLGGYGCYLGYGLDELA